MLCVCAKTMQRSLLKSCINRRLCERRIGFSSDTIDLSAENNAIDNLNKSVNGMPNNKHSISASSVSTLHPVDVDNKLQPQWVSLERRMINRKPNNKKPTGRHNLNKSAWDHEHV